MAAAVVLATVAQIAGDVPVRPLDRGSQSGIEDARQVIVSSSEQFARLWREHSLNAQPAVDFSRESVVAVFLGPRNTAGYAVEVVAVSHTVAGDVVIRYREQSPPTDAVTAQVLTFPFVIVAIPGKPSDVRFELQPAPAVH